MNRLILIFSILLLSALAQSADAQTQVRNTLHDFTSDGCSLSPDGVVPGQTEFVPCCVAHDVAYWAGGTREEKEAADVQLRVCIKEKSDELRSFVYFAGVRIGGGAFMPTPFHWGYGWEKRRGYKALSEEQKQVVDEKLHQVDWYKVYTSLDIQPVR